MISNRNIAVDNYTVVEFFATATGIVTDLSTIAPLARATSLEYENFRNEGILTNNPIRKCIYPLFLIRD